MLGYEQISLEEDEFTTQWKAIATEEERDNFLKEDVYKRQIVCRSAADSMRYTAEHRR